MAPTPAPSEEPDPLAVCLLLARADAELRKRFDASLSSWHGLSRNDFTILLHLRRAPEGQLRRVDLAERLGLTPSGVTRLLGPLERIGLVERRTHPADARVALTGLTPAGEQMADDAQVTASTLAEDILHNRMNPNQLADLQALLARLAPA